MSHENVITAQLVEIVKEWHTRWTINPLKNNNPLIKKPAKYFQIDCSVIFLCIFESNTRFLLRKTGMISWYYGISLWFQKEILLKWRENFCIIFKSKPLFGFYSWEANDISWCSDFAWSNCRKNKVHWKAHWK